MAAMILLTIRSLRQETKTSTLGRKENATTTSVCFVRNSSAACDRTTGLLKLAMMYVLESTAPAPMDRATVLLKA